MLHFFGTPCIIVILILIVYCRGLSITRQAYTWHLMGGFERGQQCQCTIKLNMCTLPMTSMSLF